MYAYTIYRGAIEWAFEAANLPLIKRSPWPYAYDAAFMVRHDFENLLSLVLDIENSARYKASIGVKGDYYFTRASSAPCRPPRGSPSSTVCAAR